MLKANLKTLIILSGLLLPVRLLACYGELPGNLWDSWNKSSLVVLGKPVRENNVIRGAVYSMEVAQIYKGEFTENSITFKDMIVACGVPVISGKTSLVFLAYRQEGWGVLNAIEADKATQPDIEEGISAVKTFNALPPDAKKPFLLEQLKKNNPLIKSSILNEVLSAKYPEAMPYFREQPASAKTDAEKLSHAGSLRSLGAPEINAQIIGWLEDPDFTAKVQAIEDLVKAHDLAALGAIKKYIDAKDERLAAEARTALLRLGEESAKGLVLQSIANGKDPVARYNSIHTLNWNYNGAFTQEEKNSIEAFTKDPDESIARVASMLVEKWK
jgi:hypothetical protein